MTFEETEKDGLFWFDNHATTEHRPTKQLFYAQLRFGQQTNVSYNKLSIFFQSLLYRVRFVHKRMDIGGEWGELSPLKALPCNLNLPVEIFYDPKWVQRDTLQTD